jgi:uncharacterized protein with ParB-like and HNH nuclease domain
MKANEINLNRFLSQSDTQFIIPVYQRNYDWTYTQCKKLFSDIFESGNTDEISAHFIGSIVYIHDDVYSVSNIRELTIIDGQQRLTTITLIYLVLYHLAKANNNKALENRIHETFLINKFAETTEKLKLRPTENNDKAIKFLLASFKNDFPEYSRIIENYNYFSSVINKTNYEIVLQGLSKLMFVEISLDREKDDPQKIFESLNSTGLELSQADLIRNYILMRLSKQQQDHIFKTYWERIEHLAKDYSNNSSKISDFIRDYLTLYSNKIPNKNKVYQEFKQIFSSLTYEKLEEILIPIIKMANHYKKFINPDFENDKEIRKQLNYVKKIEINVSYPFLLQIYEDFSNSLIDKQTLIKILNLIQSFVWRRFIVGLPTNALNKIFMKLYEEVDPKDYLQSIQRALLNKKGSQRFPQNVEVINSLKEKDLYNIKSKNRLYFFERIENFNNKECVEIENNEKITIEHIFPQNPDAKWKVILGEEEYRFIKDNCLNTIANLTLSGNNGALGNKYFIDKRDMNIDGKEQGYLYSRLWINRFLSQQKEWNKTVIEERFNILKQRFLEIWPYPIIEKFKNKKIDVVNIFEADDPTGKKIDYILFFDQKIIIHTVSKLYYEVIKVLFDIQPQTFFTKNISQTIGLTKKKENCRKPHKINETYYIESNLNSKDKIKRIKMLLKTFELEDELMVKFQ